MTLQQIGDQHGVSFETVRHIAGRSKKIEDAITALQKLRTNRDRILALYIATRTGRY